MVKLVQAPVSSGTAGRCSRPQGLSLTGPDGLLKQLTKTVLETALNEEMTEHLGYEKHDQAGAGGGNIRNGTRPTTVLTDTTGLVQIDVPRDRAGTFEPQIVRKRQRRLSGVDEVVLSLYAKGLTTGEISAHFAEIYGTFDVQTSSASHPFWTGKQRLVDSAGRVERFRALRPARDAAGPLRAPVVTVRRPASPARPDAGRRRTTRSRRARGRRPRHRCRRRWPRGRRG
ncbi:transposase, partial [Micromonospora musae]|uniref:50S ribosomal protein L31 n=1 Tax=Micromonospora musae TaxID=1894970 RepID=UPI003F4D1438